MICCLGGLHSLKCCGDESDGFWSCGIRRDKCLRLHLNSVGSSVLPWCLWPCQTGVCTHRWAAPTLCYWKMLLSKTGGWRTWTPKISYLENHSFPCMYLYPASYKLRRDKEPIQEKTVSTWVCSPRAADSVYSPIGNSSSTSLQAQNTSREENKTISSISSVGSTFICSEEKQSD